MIRPAELIERKRNGEELAADEISQLILGYARGEVPDYQLAAWCMAVYFRGLSGAETFALTDAMIRSGETLDLGSRARPARGRQALDGRRRRQDLDRGRADRRRVRRAGREDERPRARAHGRHARQARVDSRLPTSSSPIDAFVEQVREVGLAIVGQTADLVPADKQLYGLRDVTGTVDIVPLIASSIMSKKIAGGADAIVLDVKVGDGAFMKTLEDAQVLAESMLELGRRAEREVVCLLTDMDQPLGAAVGNALEIREARDTVRGEGPPDFTELVLDACARMLAFSDLGVDVDEGRRRAEAAVADGSALERLRALDPGAGRRSRPGGAAAGGGRARGRGAPSWGGHEARRDPDRPSRAASRRGPQGEGGLDRPRGRHRLPGEARREVDAGDVLAEVHAREDAAADEAVREVLAAYELGDEPPPERTILLDVVGQ